MNHQEKLIQLIQQGETEHIEFKREFPQSAEDIAKEIIAFANKNGGTLFIGVADDGTIVGVNNPDNIIQRITGVVRKCDPPLQPKINTVNHQGKALIVVHISRHNIPVSINGKFYVRVGTSAMFATSRDLTKLLVKNLLEKVDLLDAINEPFEGFSPENLMPVSSNEHKTEDAETERIGLYEGFEGVFLIHRWRSSTYSGQKADIVINLTQHGQGPLATGQIESVDYFLGPKFPGSPYHKTNAKENFSLNVSAYAPMLCLAKVRLKNGKMITLYRYCDFPDDL